jgi:hypothetical protein
MSTCLTCKHFVVWDKEDPVFRGECLIELPRWLNVIIDEPVCRFVRTDDACSLHTEESK